MRFCLTLMTILALGATAAQAGGDNASPDRLLAGRTPGRPVTCIGQTMVQDTRTFDDGSIYYRMAGTVDYLNRPHQCSALKSGRAYVTRVPSTQLCAGDMLDIFDPASHVPYGSCAYDAFVPYPKLRKH